MESVNIYLRQVYLIFKTAGIMAQKDFTNVSR